MEEEFNMDGQDSALSDHGNRSVDGDNMSDSIKDFGDQGYDECFEDDEGGGNFRNNRGRGNFRNRGRGPPPGWMNGPPMRFRGRGYGPAGPPMRGRAFFRTRGGPRFSNPPNFDGNWGPMGPPPPGMMGGPPPFGPPPGMMPPGGPMGPPPNMMGQPPPFGGPPAMPPPNMPAPELWVETKSEDGKSYYYHARTRETTWTRPQDGPTCKVITQQEMEAMATSGQMPGMPGQNMPPMSGPMGGMPGPMGGMPPNGMMPQMMPPSQQPPGGPVPPFMTQPPPWVKEGHKEGGMGPEEGSVPHQMDSDDAPPGEAPPLVPTSVAGLPPGANPFAGGPGPNFSPAGGPGPNFPPAGGPGPNFSPAGGPGPNFSPAGGPGPNFSNAPPNFSGGPPNMAQLANMGNPLGGHGQPGGPPPGGFPGAWGGWGGWPPPLVANPPPNLGNAAMPDAGAAAQQMPPGGTEPPGVRPDLDHMQPDTPHHQPDNDNVIPPELEAAAAEWTTHRAPDGRPYYHHAASQESIWEKPAPMKELEELQARVQAEKDRAEKLAIIKDKEIKKNMDIIDVEAHEQEKAAAEAKAIADRERAAAEEREQQERERLEKEKAEREKVEKEKAEKEKAEKEKEKAKADKSRPISSTPISGTPWCVVWTGDGRVFFYNPTAHSSVWERPPQLLGREDVDKVVGEMPQALLEQQRKEQPATAASKPPVVGKAANGELKRSADSDTEDSDAEPIKKTKTEEASKKPVQIDLGKEAAIEAEVRAARERGVVPHSQRLRSFLAMLHEKQVSAFSTWEKELHKIVFDPRYLMLNSKERRQVFDQYVRERAEEERKEKKNRLLQKKQAFRTLLEEAKLHSKSSFTDLASKHGRDERFKAIEKVRERELYFNEYIVEVRKKEKEDKEKKRDQAKLEFFALLKEKGVDRHARFSEVKKKCDSEARWKGVEGGVTREDYFREFCKQLKDDRRKDKDTKDRDRSSKKEKKEKERDKEKEKDKDGKKEKKKEKGEAQTEEERKQPTPPPDQWAEILGIPGQERAKATKKKLDEQKQLPQKATTSEDKSSEEEMPSPKQLRSSKKEQPNQTEKMPIKSPLKKRKIEEPPQEADKKQKKKVEKKPKASEKTDKRKRKKNEKD